MSKVSDMLSLEEGRCTASGEHREEESMLEFEEPSLTLSQLLGFLSAFLTVKKSRASPMLCAAQAFWPFLGAFQLEQCAGIAAIMQLEPIRRSR